MADLKGTALLPTGDKNGLTPVADQLVKEPLKVRAALVLLNLKRGTEDYDIQDTQATVRVLRIELLLPQDLAQAEVMIRRALEFRNDQPTLPYELEDEIREAFEAMKDPESVEDPDEPSPPDDKPKP